MEALSVSVAGQRIPQADQAHSMLGVMIGAHPVGGTGSWP